MAKEKAKKAEKSSKKFKITKKMVELFIGKI